MVAREVEADVPRGVRGGFDHDRDMVAEPDGIALAQAVIERRDFSRLGRGAVDLGTGRMLDRLVAAGVIGVPVRVPDRIDAPAAQSGRASWWERGWREG